MAKRGMGHPKSVFVATAEALDAYEPIADKSPDGVPAVLGSLLTNLGNPKPGLRRWRLKQDSGLGTSEFNEALLWLVENEMIYIRGEEHA